LALNVAGKTHDDADTDPEAADAEANDKDEYDRVRD
jgi:hypothetical protein